MVKRTAPDTEPEESQFPLLSEKEHLFQITDVNPLVTPGGTDDNVQIVKIEVIGGEEEGNSILNRINIDDSEKSFYYARLFLKAIGEPYKGEFEIDPDNWVGKQFYATIKHTESKGKKYANINEYNFDKKVENQYKKPVGDNKSISAEDIAWEE